MVMRWVFVAMALVAATCADKPLPHYDCIVVGMGAAGTMAASTLSRAGKKVLALEATDRVGGRVRTVPFAGGVAEMGAEWTQGQGPSLTYKAAMEHNITLLSQEKVLSDMEVVLSDGSLADPVLKDVVHKGIELCEEGYAGEKPQPVGEWVTKKLMDYIKEKHPEMENNKEMIARVLDFLDQSVNSVDACDSWMDIDGSVPYEILPGDQHLSWHKLGYKTLFELLLNTYKGGPGLPSLELKLNSPVLLVQWPQKSDQLVTVTDNNGHQYTADTVIVTVSLGVLKEEHENMFSPPLPQDKKTAIEKLDMGVIGKIIFSFDKPWWRNTVFGLLWKPEDLKKVAAEDQWTTKIMGATPAMGCDNAFTVWTGGATAKLVETLPEEQVKTKVMALLRRFFPNETIPEPTGMLRPKWFHNEWTRGSYSFTGMSAAQTPNARRLLAAPVKDNAGRVRLLLAGEAAHPTRCAWYHNEWTRGSYSFTGMSAAQTANARRSLAAPVKDSAGRVRLLLAGEAAHPTKYATVHGAADSGFDAASIVLGKEKVA